MINSIINEAEKWIYKLKGRMMEITVMDQNKGKKGKEMKIVSETSSKTINTLIFKLQVS